MVALPGLVLTRHHVSPSRASQTGDVDLSIFYTASMLRYVRAFDFNLKNWRTRASGYGSPCIARNCDWVYAVRNHAPTQPKIIFSSRIGAAITHIVETLRS